MVTRIVLRRDTTQNWELVNPVLSRGEFGVEIQESGSRRIKTGDGITTWNELNYSYISVEEFTDHLTDLNAHDIENITNAINGDITRINNTIDGLVQVDNNLINRITDAENGISQNTDNISALENTANQDRQDNQNSFNAINNGISILGDRTLALEVATHDKRRIHQPLQHRDTEQQQRQFGNKRSCRQGERARNNRRHADRRHSRNKN